MRTTSEQDRIVDGIEFALTLNEVMADLDAGWAEWAADPSALPTPGLVHSVR